MDQQQVPNREVCGLHSLLMEVLEKLDKRMESLPAMEIMLQSLTKTVQGNGRGSLAERLTLLEDRFTNIADLQIASRFLKIENQLAQILGTLDKLKLEETLSSIRADLDKLSTFYKTIKGLAYKVAIPLIIAALLGAAGFIVDIWSHVHAVPIPGVKP